MKKLFAFVLLAALCAVTVSASHNFNAYDRYGDRYIDYYYDDPIYVNYDGLGRYNHRYDGYRCVGNGCYATDYLYAGYGYGGYRRNFGSYGCSAYYCNEHWNEDYEYIIPPAYRGRSYPRW